jgi:hypothetical protein
LELDWYAFFYNFGIAFCMSYLNIFTPLNE